MSLFYWNLSLILVSLLKMLVLKCCILRVEIHRFFKKSKNKENTTCILTNQLIGFHIEFLRLRHYKVDLLYMREFDVKTYKVDLLDCMCCVLFILLNVQWTLQISTRSIRHFNANFFGKLSRIKCNIMMIQHIFRENVM